MTLSVMLNWTRVEVVVCVVEALHFEWFSSFELETLALSVENLPVANACLVTRLLWTYVVVVLLCYSLLPNTDIL